MKEQKSRWTDKEILKLISMVENYNNIEIATYFNTTTSAIRNVMRRRNIKRSSTTKQRFIKAGVKKAASIRKSWIGDKNPNWRGGISKDSYHYKKLQIERYPERVKARVAVHNALKSGKLKRGTCEICKSSKVQAHHNDYSKPLEVQWFCKKHHREYMHNKEHFSDVKEK